jgi:hypothetical protein
MAKMRALLLAKMDPPIEGESEWNDCYDNRHVADRLTIPGFLSARRFTKMEGIPKEYAIAGEAKYLALYDLTNVNVLLDKPYQKLREKESARPPDSFETLIFKLPKFARGVYEQIYPEEGEYERPSTRYAFVVGHDVPRNRQQEFQAWYDTEHTPALLAVPGFLAVRRFKLNEHEVPPTVDRGGTLSKYLTIWDIRNEHALESNDFRKASLSPWSNWVRSWYTRKICTVYYQIYPK